MQFMFSTSPRFPFCVQPRTAIAVVLFGLIGFGSHAWAECSGSITITSSTTNSSTYIAPSAWFCTYSVSRGITLNQENEDGQNQDVGLFNYGRINNLIFNGGTTGYPGPNTVSGVGLYNGGQIGTTIVSATGFMGGLYNAAVMSDIVINGIAVNMQNLSEIGTLTNNGYITGNDDPGFKSGLYNSGRISNLVNNTGAKITYSYSAGGSSSAPAPIWNARSGYIGAFTNLGYVYTVGSYSPLAVVNYGGVIAELNNAQGGSGGALGRLSYAGTFPLKYNIIIQDLTHFGQFVKNDATHLANIWNIPKGTTQFGISPLSTTSSSILNVTFSTVLSGVSSEQLGLGSATSVSSISNGYSYTLFSSGGNDWSLIITGFSAVSSVASILDGSVVSLKQNLLTGLHSTLSNIGVKYYPVFDGGTLMLNSGDAANQAFGVLSAGGIITAPSSGSATLSGVFSGVGGLTFNGTGTTILTGANTYSGGTTVSSGTLSVAGDSPTGTGAVSVALGATLMGTGTIAGALTVAGTLKPGNSPGYLASTANVTMTSGSTYQQDIAGTIQASPYTTAGETGYYSHLNITGGHLIINPGATLAPRLSNLFSATESGYGSAPYIPVLGNRFTIVTADGGIAGKFSTLDQPAELTPGTQFLAFYNMGGTNSLELALIPSSYQATVAGASGNKNAQSVGGALDRMVVAAQAGSATSAQEQLLYAGASQRVGGLPAYTQSMAGEVYPATVSVIAQTTQRVQQAVLSRLGDTMGLSLANVVSVTSGASAAAQGLVPSASQSQPYPQSQSQSSAHVNVWGEALYQKGARNTDALSGGWSSNLYQLVFGSDLVSTENVKVGGGLALSNTTLRPTYGSATIQQGALFAYGKVTIQTYVVDAMASAGVSSSDLARGDVTGLGNSGFRNQYVSGTDALLSLGVSRAFEFEELRLTPFARVSWQLVSQPALSEGNEASALSLKGYTGQGMRGVLGVALGSKANTPLTEQYTYRTYMGLGAETTGVLNPTLDASVAGVSTTIQTPRAGTAFIQAGLYGTAKFADNAYAYAGLSAEVRTGQTLYAGSVGLRLAF
jgi:autotransporter-associated beta strand protein